MLNKNNKIYVFADWSELKSPTLVGELMVTQARGKEIFSFEYDKNWLASPRTYSIDPSLQLYSGRQFPTNSQNSFGIFLDSSPDRWGRVLMQRKEAVLANQEKRPVRQLLESDYLLGVYDETRMGALRFKTDLKGDFLNNDKKMAAPPWTTLRQLEEASLNIEDDSLTNQNEYLNWLNLLIAPGSSLGGARPKASVVDADGHLWIAKFPSKQDTIDIGAWEMLANKLSANAGINVSIGKLDRFSGKYHTFLSKRFDRDLKQRVHFASAMTLLNKSDGENGSYLDLASFIIHSGAAVQQDLTELWKRMVFNICISNTDDHLRNHGFLLTPNGWKLAPAYDINPNQYGNGLTLNISEHDNSQNLDLAIEVAQYFRINKNDAKKLISDVTNAVERWRDVAASLKIPRIEQDIMASAFKVPG